MTELRDALYAQAAALRVQADTLQALAEAVSDVATDELLDLAALRTEYAIGRDGVLSAVGRGELTASRGPRGRILVARSEIERFLRSRPVRRKPLAPQATVVSLEEWDRQADGRLAVGGRR